MKVIIGILTVSDRASQGVYEDLSGKAVIHELQEYLTSEWNPLYRIVPDDRDIIVSALTELVDEHLCSLVITTGGTGPSDRDVTPEATAIVCDKMLPGFGELMRANSLKYVPTAILSRQTAGIRKKALLINLPGKPRSIKECLEAVFPAVPYCIELLGGPSLICDEKAIEVFRPTE